MDTTSPAPFSRHREDREAGRLVYPVYSRRSGGLSLGINLFPDRKRCNFDCPYCEVFPFSGKAAFDPAELERELAGFAQGTRPGIVKDICFSGNGEPTLSPYLEEALFACAAARVGHPAVLGEAKLVLITNSSGFLDASVSSLLALWARTESLEIWAKLDAGTEGLFSRMSRSAFKLAEIAAAIEAFSAVTPITIQTMLCLFGGDPASPASTLAEAGAYANLVSTLASRGSLIQGIQLYAQARPSPGGMTSPIGDAALRAAAALVASRTGLPVRSFGENGELR